MVKLYLSSNQYIRYFSLTLFYLAQGFPIGLVIIALPAYLSSAGASAAQIGSFVAISSLPWAFKLLAGPIMDRFAFPPMGRRRPWVVFAQAGLVIAALCMGLVPNPINDIWLLTWAAFAVNFFSALQDVAVDGMAIDVLPIEQRGRANAFMAFGQVAGYSGSGALCALLLSDYGIDAAAMLVAAGVGLIFVWSVITREREGERLLPWSEGSTQEQTLALKADSWRDIGTDLLKALLLPTSIMILVFTLFWRVADGLWITITPLITTQDLGYASTEYSYWTATASFIAAIVGLLIGMVVDQKGAQITLAVSIGALAFVCLVAGFATDYWDRAWFPLMILFAYSFAGQFIFVSFIALCMNVCCIKVSATQFALYMGWSNLARSIGAALSGAIAPYTGVGHEFLLMAFVCIVAAILVSLLDLGKHRDRLNALASPTET